MKRRLADLDLTISDRSAEIYLRVVHPVFLEGKTT